MMEIDALGGRQQFNCNDVRHIVEHGVQAARRERCHADMIFLVGRRRDTIHARGMRV